MKTKQKIWAQRNSRLRSFLPSLPRRLRDDAKALIEIFKIRQSLKLRLCDKYLEALWETSRSTVQRTLKKLEAAGLITRVTFPPKREKDGGWKQMRYLVLKLPKEQKSSLVCHSDQQSNLQSSTVGDNSTQAVKQKTKIPFLDYLTTQVTVSPAAFMYFVRSEGASESSMGHLKKNVWPLIKNRPDKLEEILWCAKDENLKGSQLIGFLVTQIQQQLGKYQ